MTRTLNSSWRAGRDDCDRGGRGFPIRPKPRWRGGGGAGIGGGTGRRRDHSAAGASPGPPLLWRLFRLWAIPAIKKIRTTGGLRLWRGAYATG